VFVDERACEGGLHGLAAHRFALALAQMCAVISQAVVSLGLVCTNIPIMGLLGVACLQAAEEAFVLHTVLCMLVCTAWYSAVQGSTRTVQHSIVYLL
jgi:hypothetical protein